MDKRHRGFSEPSYTQYVRGRTRGGCAVRDCKETRGGCERDKHLGLSKPHRYTPILCREGGVRERCAVRDCKKSVGIASFRTPFDISHTVECQKKREAVEMFMSGPVVVQHPNCTHNSGRRDFSTRIAIGRIDLCCHHEVFYIGSFELSPVDCPT